MATQKIIEIFSPSHLFSHFKSILKVYEKEMIVLADQPDTYYLAYPYTEKGEEESIFFAAVQVKRSAVTAYLGAISRFPQLIHQMPMTLFPFFSKKNYFMFNLVDSRMLRDFESFVSICYRTELMYLQLQMEKDRIVA